METLQPNSRPSSRQHPSAPCTPRKLITVGLDENLNPNPESLSIRVQMQAQILGSFNLHLAALNHLDSAFRKPLKASLTASQLESLFSNLKYLRLLYIKLSKTLSASKSSANFERTLADIFTGKLGKALEWHSVHYTVNYRLNVPPLVAKLCEDSSSKLANLEAAHQGGPSQWASFTFLELLDSVTGNLVAYPGLLDRLLQETPLQSEAYQKLEETLVSARNMAKLVVDAKEGNLKKEEEEVYRQKPPHLDGWFQKWLDRLCGRL